MLSPALSRNYASVTLSKSTGSSVQWCYLVRSLMRHSVPRNYLLHLITDLRHLVVVNPYFPRLNSENKQNSRPAEHLLEQMSRGHRVAYAKRLIVTFRLHITPSYSVKMHFHLLAHAIPRQKCRALLERWFGVMLSDVNAVNLRYSDEISKNLKIRSIYSIRMTK